MAPNRDPNRLLRAIFASARAHGVTNEGLHETIWLTLQKRSLKDLTTDEAMQLLDGLNGKEYRPPQNFSYRRRQAMSLHGRKDHDRSQGAAFLVNEREIKMLGDAAALRGWSAETVAAFIERQVGHEIRTMADFNKVFWALKRMNKRDGLWQ
jgi:hypothetical protein